MIRLRKKRIRFAKSTDIQSQKKEKVTKPQREHLPHQRMRVQHQDRSCVLVSTIVVLLVCQVNAFTEFYPVCDQVTLLGFPCQTHIVTTADGFQLSVNRIPPKMEGAYPVYLQHGLLDTSVTWVANAYANQNLATILHNAGYDVWMSNARGNHYSMGNTQYSQSDPNYWLRIDMDWMAKYDLPAVIDYILANVTNHTKLSYVGHSQGGMMGFAGFSTWNPEYAKKVDVFVALAPACRVGQTTSFLIKLLADLDVDAIFEIFGLKEFLANDWLLRQIASFCGDLGGICPDILDIIVGDGNPANINQSQIDTILRYDPGGTSVNNMVHWAQEVRSGEFQAHDYGSVQNQVFYNSTTAPKYNLSAMQGPPTFIFSGSNDALADPQDVEWIVASLPASVMKGSTVINGFAHMDFVWGLDAYSLLYPQILQLIEQYRS
uniref:Lipase n=1 Tax=Bodo saltans TaxID=75058 RepID=B6DT69_BODSA|nr:carboxylic ester hydrolase [Bodo saltans]